MRNNKKNDPNKFRDEKHNILELIVDNKKLVMPIILVIAVVITIVIAVRANKKVTEETQSVQDLSAAAASSTYEVPEVDLELNAYADVNELITKYFQANADGDVDTISSIYAGLDETTKIKIREVSNYIESYPTVDVYTKPGPVDGSYVVYAYTQVKLNDYEQTIPGMETMYVCTNEEGSLYINGDVVDDNVMDYIMEISLQDDVVDLNNKVAAEYNDMISNDTELATLLSDIKSNVEVSVGETLAASASSESSEETDESEAAASEASSEETTEPETTTVTTRVLKATEVVNVRSSDSTTAEVLGKTAIGDEYTELESLANGWSKIEYNGSTAYVKTEFFEVVSETTEEVTTETETETTEEETTEETTEEETTVNTSTKTGKMQVTETVRLRKSESTDSEVLTTIYKGSTVNVIEQYANGWAKVEYDSKTGYIKAEFLDQ